MMRTAAALGLLLLLAGCNSLGGVGGIPIVRDLDDPLAEAVGEVEGCPVVLGQTRPPDPAAVDAAINAERGAPGMYEVNGVRLFHGTMEVAASAFDGLALFVGRDGEAWLRMAPGRADRLSAFETIEARRLWFASEVAGVDEC